MPVNAAAVTVLVDNEAGEGLRAEHGLSLLVETGGRTVLFDTGQGAALRHNALLLGVRLGSIDALVLSHGHYDHTGGAAELLSAAPHARLIMHPNAAIERYSVPPGKEPRAIGMPTAVREAIARLPAGAVVKARAPVDLGPGIGVTGPIPRETPWEDVGGPFFMDPQGRQPDAIEDDQALWIATPDGAIVCVGCSHAGLINTLRYVRRVSGIETIRAVIGGFHLCNAKKRRMEETRKALRAPAPGMLAPCHCTGAGAVRALRDEACLRVAPCRAGARFLFPPHTAGGCGGASVPPGTVKEVAQ
jgi:7,8-dihydropterin-6-yl-methyl-4-(beta-D-ribofuranosyl)aminobenzene 5'-phosphate synthase